MITEPPLVIDLDGTLLRSDLLFETAIFFLHKQPYRFLSLLYWYIQGKACLKQKLADATHIDITALPYNEDVLAFIKSERSRGRQIVLATASNQKLAHQVAEHLEIFDSVIASDAHQNLCKKVKRDALIAKFGDKQFDYAGNSKDDLPVWKASRRAYVVDASRQTEQRALAQGNVAQVFKTDTHSLNNWIKAIRLHHWLKNILVLFPLLLCNTDHVSYEKFLIAFFCFGLCASNVYLLNDLLDLNEDRHHPQKRQRPFASGKVSIVLGVLVAPLFLLTSFALSLSLLPLSFNVVLGVYYLLTLSYSFYIKRFPILDIILLSILYTLRIISGYSLLNSLVNPLLIMFFLFFFLSLALVKRYSELLTIRENKKDIAKGRNYSTSHIPFILTIGLSSGYLAVCMLALYFNEPSVAASYQHQERIWLVFPLLIAWFSHIWLLTSRGRVKEDLIAFCLEEKSIFVTFFLIFFIFWI